MISNEEFLKQIKERSVELCKTLVVYPNDIKMFSLMGAASVFLVENSRDREHLERGIALMQDILGEMARNGWDGKLFSTRRTEEEETCH